MSMKIPAGFCRVCAAEVGIRDKYCPAHQKPSKYRAVKTEIDGLRFDSRREGNRYKFLSLLLKCGKIEDLECQVRYPLAVNGVLVCVYVADFVYRHEGKKIVEDVKGYRTKEYKLKAKLFAAVMGFEIVEV